jgi:uncharacterized SAM-binding protein YcdF (DUF218 family)
MLEDHTPLEQEGIPRIRPWLSFLVAVCGAFILFFGYTGMRIVHAAGEIPAHKADAIVVFGAAEYAGRPSPVYRARLDHAFDLFQQGMAPVVITTGGAAQDPEFSEGGVGRDYLVHRGIPEKNLIAETQSSDTAQSAGRVANIMRANGMKTCIAVSDAYHVFRIRALLDYEGVPTQVAPRPESRPRSRREKFTAVMREALSYFLWEVGMT